MVWIHLAEYRGQWLPLINTIMNTIMNFSFGFHERLKSMKVVVIETVATQINTIK
jgi:hypothetical protein